MHSRIILAVLSLLWLASSVQAASQVYSVQRRLGIVSEWATIASFTVTRQSSQSPAHIRFKATAGVDLTKEEKQAITAADIIYYRAIPKDGDAAAVADASVVAVTPCSIIRGFEAVDSRTVVLHEKIKVLPGPGTSIIGLQLSSETNFFHSKMLRGAECDLSVVEKLFPVVRVQLTVGLLHATEPLNKVRYEDLGVLQEGAAEASAAKTPKTTTRKVKNDQGEWVEEEVPVDNRSFLQKYWMYFLIPVIMSFLQKKS